jgi:hypothetical protein
VTLCVVCTVHMEMRSADFLVAPQNQGRFCGLKTTQTVFFGLASKPMAQVSRFGPKNWQLRFRDLDLKITAMVSWFWAQNQVGFSLSVVPQNQRREDGMGHTSRSSGLLHLKASRARVFQSGLKTDRGATSGGARGIITEDASDPATLTLSFSMY